MRRKHAFIADHMAHARPSRPPSPVSDLQHAVYKAQINQHELDLLMLMDSLGMGGDPFNRGEFLRRVDKTFREDERCRAGDPPVDV